MKLIELSSAGFDISINKKYLTKRTTCELFPEALNDIIQASLAIDNLYYSKFQAPPSTERIEFLRETENWFSSKNIEIHKNPYVTSTYGYKLDYDYKINLPKRTHNTFVKTVATPQKRILDSIVFNAMELKKLETSSEPLIIIKEQTNENTTKNFTQTLYSYNINNVMWNNIDSLMVA